MRNCQSAAIAGKRECTLNSVGDIQPEQEYVAIANNNQNKEKNNENQQDEQTRTFGCPEEN